MDLKPTPKLLKSTIILQNNIRYNLEYVNSYNESYEKTKNRMVEIIDRIQNNYDIGLINQEKYNSTMQKIEDILIKLTNLQYPLKIKDFRKSNVIDLKLELYEIKENVIELVCECGSSTLMTVVNILVSDNSKIFNTSTSKYLDFLDNVFIPIGTKITESDKDSDNEYKGIIFPEKLKLSLLFFKISICGSTKVFP